MRTTSILLQSLILAGALAEAAQLPSGLSFDTPAGWTVKSNDNAAALLPPDVAMEPGGTNQPSELYLVAMPEGIPDNVNQQHDAQAVSRLLARYLPGARQVTPSGLPQPFRGVIGTGFLYRFTAVNEAVALRINVYITVLPEHRAAVLLAIGRPAVIARREVVLLPVAASLSHTVAPRPAIPAGAFTSQWDQRLRGKKLYLFSGYSSSYGSGGMNSERTLLLASDGTYQFHSASSVSVYAAGANGTSASRNSDRGSWRIYQKDAAILLELVSAEGVTENIVLTSQGSKVLLNGRRWLVSD